MEYRLCLDNLDQLVQFGFKLNWTLLQIGYQGYNFIPPLLTRENICIYAMRCLDLTEDNLVARLACAKNDEYEFEKVLNKLTRNENVRIDVQWQKWRCLLLFKHFQNLPEDYTNGLIDLTELWISLGLPDDSPHIIQGRNNFLSPHEYYTQAMYDNLKKRNEDWLSQEISNIIETERE